MLRLERRLLALAIWTPSRTTCSTATPRPCPRLPGACRLDVTGVADRETFDALFGADAPVAGASSPTTSTPATRATPCWPCRNRWRSTACWARSRRRLRFGYLGGAGALLYDYLLDNGSPYAENFAMYDGVAARAQELLATEDFFFYDGTLERGDSGDEVLRLQRRLYTLYYVTKGILDGDYGAKTEWPSANSRPPTAWRRPAWPMRRRSAPLLCGRRGQEHQVQIGGAYQRPARLRLRPELLRRIRAG